MNLDIVFEILISTRGVDVRYIIPVIVGAIIGYITNWLAIKMLFRPHEEKRFLGFHIPLTPGLIPKERTRIAKSVGETVGVYLLSPEIILSNISDDKVEASIKRWVKSNIYKLRKENRSIKYFISNLSYGKSKDVLSGLKKRIGEFVCTEIRKDKFKNGVMDLIKEHILGESKKSLYTFIDERLGLLLSEISTSNDVRNLLKNDIEDKLIELTRDERRLSEVIPESFINTIKYSIKEHGEDIANVLRDILDDEITEMKIKESIKKQVSQNMNRLIAVFVNSDMISDKVYNMIKEYVSTPQMDENIVDMLITVVDKMLEKRLDSVSNSIISKIGEEEIFKISDIILGYILNEKNRRKVTDIISEEIKNQESEIQSYIINSLSNEIEKILNSEALYNNVYMAIDNAVEFIISRPVSSVLENINETSITNITKLCLDLFNYFIKNELPHIVEMFSISKIVEEQINSYDVAFAEELILNIADRELKAITWLGALLGGIMGILTPLLQMI